MRVAMYIVGQERRLVNPPSQVVAGVRTVTTNMDGRDVLPRLSRPFAFLQQANSSLKVSFSNSMFLNQALVQYRSYVKEL